MAERKVIEIRNPKELAKREIAESPKDLTRLRGSLADPNSIRSNDQERPLDEFETRRKQFFGL